MKIVQVTRFQSYFGSQHETEVECLAKEIEHQVSRWVSLHFNATGNTMWDISKVIAEDTNTLWRILGGEYMIEEKGDCDEDNE